MRRSCHSKSKLTKNLNKDYLDSEALATDKTHCLPILTGIDYNDKIIPNTSPSNITLKNSIFKSGLKSQLTNNAQITHDINMINNRHQCKYCLTCFARKDNLTRHIKNNCKVKKQGTEEKEQIYQQLLEQLKNTSNNNCNNTTNNTQNNNTQNNNIQINNEIKLVGFGKEDLYNIEDKVVKQLLNRGLNAVRETIRYTHFNDKNEKHHNVYVSNMKDIYAMIYDGNSKKWKLTPKKEIVDTLFDYKQVFLGNRYNELYDELPESTRKKFDRFIELSDDEETVSIIKKEILMMLYNEKEIPLKTRRKMDEGMFHSAVEESHIQHNQRLLNQSVIALEDNGLLATDN
jgi:hypothetical protein